MKLMLVILAVIVGVVTISWMFSKLFDTLMSKVKLYEIEIQGVKVVWYESGYSYAEPEVYEESKEGWSRVYTGKSVLRSDFSNFHPIETATLSMKAKEEAEAYCEAWNGRKMYYQNSGNGRF